MANITFIGAGNMAEAIISGIIKAGIFTPREINALDISQERLSLISDKYGIQTSASAEEAIGKSNYIVLAVKPQNLSDIADKYKDLLKNNKILISILAGVNIDRIKALLADSLKICRVMPNLGAFTGKSVSALSFDKRFNQDEITFCENLFKSIGYSYIVPEEKMDLVTAISGSGPAYFFLFMEKYIETAVELGMEYEEAFNFCAGTMEGAMGMILKREMTPKTLREKVTSKGGTTASALAYFSENNIGNIIMGAVKAARDRSIELGKQC